MIEFRSPTDFPRGTLYDILVDAYSFDPRNRRLWDANWRQTDDFFYDHPAIADACALVTCLDGAPIGFVTWDPRNAPASVEIGHNGIRQPFKGHGYGRLQLQEALRRIKSSKSPRRILVTTNANLFAPKNYESVGFTLLSRTPNPTPSSFTGDFLHYELPLSGGYMKLHGRLPVPFGEQGSVSATTGFESSDSDFSRLQEK